MPVDVRVDWTVIGGSYFTPGYRAPRFEGIHAIHNPLCEEGLNWLREALMEGELVDLVGEDSLLLRPEELSVPLRVKDSPKRFCSTFSAANRLWYRNWHCNRLALLEPDFERSLLQFVDS